VKLDDLLGVIRGGERSAIHLGDELLGSLDAEGQRTTSSSRGGGVGHLDRNDTTKRPGPSCILASHQADVILTGNSASASLICGDCSVQGEISCRSVLRFISIRQQLGRSLQFSPDCESFGLAG
jgi:hypothetical protein